MKNTLTKWLLCAVFSFFAAPLAASVWTQWIEYPLDPIYNPYPTQTLFDDYFPSIVYNKNRFHGDGDKVYYKMWHSADNGSGGATGALALSLSNDGVNWTLKGLTNLPATATHPVVLYDEFGFGGSPYHYRMWYWNGNVGTSADVIQYTFSSDVLIGQRLFP